MNLPITRDQAIELLNSFPQEQSDMNHYLETEAIMRALAEKFGEDKEYWGMLGLLHDVDWAITKNSVSEHLKKAPEILKKAGFSEEFIDIILSHGYGHEILPELKDRERTKKIEYSLASAETLTGIIYAYALMRNGRICDMEVGGLKKKFKDKSFAANCNREIIKEIEKTGMTLEEFFSLSIEAIKKIKDQINLS